jgi:hypothetical protein
MQEQRAFFPLYQPTQQQPTAQVGQNLPSVTVAAVDATAVASTVFPGTLENTYVQIQIANKTSVWVHVNFGVLNSGNTVRAATINDYPVPPGSVVVVSVDPEVNAASVFANGAPATSTSVMFTRGEGIA